jgi:hypothetical protein
LPADDYVGGMSEASRELSHVTTQAEVRSYNWSGEGK